MTNPQPFGTPPPESIVVRLYSASNAEKRQKLLQKLASILPSVNWRGHIYIIDDDPANQIKRFSEIIQTVGEYLNEQKLSTICVRPFIRMQDSEQSEWEVLLNLTLPFQQEAYDQQSEVRMLILPIIEPKENTSAEDILGTADFFRSQLAKPSFYFNEQSPLDPQAVLDKDLRVYINQDDPSVENVISQLWINHIFEGIIERVETDQSNLLEPCCRHIIINEEDMAISPCFDQWNNGKSSDSLELTESTNCPDCISQSCLHLGDNPEANGKSEEGRQVFMGLSIALSKEGKHKEAVEYTRKAFELSESKSDKASALLHQGLCQLQLMELNEADETLKEGLTYSDDPGLFTYHRGVVQFTLQSYVNAVMLFEEALGANSPQVPKDDMIFNLATSYVNLDQFSQARSYLGLVHQITSPVRFYEGVCNLGEGMVEPALEKFRQALEMGPAPADLSRIHFYIANCLKEMGQYNESVAELQKAIDADPEDYMNYNLLGFCLYQNKEHEKAIIAFNNALAINPGSAIDYASIGSNLRELGKLEESIAMYHMALSLDPTLTFAKENIVKLKALLDSRSD